ncbi:MAG: U-box domain-containing protein [Candidatus Rhabdochlamydia sp.]
MYEEDDLNLNLSNCKNQPNAIEQLEIQVAREEAEIEAEAQRKKAIIEAEAQKKKATVKNRASLKIARINLIYENAIFVENGPHRNMYPTPKEFIDLIEREVGVINFIKQPEISGPIARTAFTVIKVATSTFAYIYVFPKLNATCNQLIENYLNQIPIVGPFLNTSLGLGLRIIDLPRTLIKKAWDPTKIWKQDYNVDHEGYFDGFIFNEDGTPKMYETSEREETKFMGIVIGLSVSVVMAPHVMSAAIGKINELRAAHLLNQDWARTFFSSYFEWKVRKLRDIEAQYSIPDVFQNYPDLDQPEYKCAHSGQLLIIPFKTPSNKIFQYSVIENWLLSNHTCPVTKENLQANQLSFDPITYEEIRHRLQAISR